jgi:hypothetical protein
MERRAVRAMQLDPAELGADNWKLLREKIWTSRVLVEVSANPDHAPRSVTASRQFGTEAESLEGLWTHIIPLPSRAQAEALSFTLLHRIRPNPHSVVREVNGRPIGGIELQGASSVRVLEKDTVGNGMTGRDLYIVAVVDHVAFGVGYGSLGDGWTQDRFVGVAQLQADKIRSKLAAA